MFRTGLLFLGPQVLKSELRVHSAACLVNTYLRLHHDPQRWTKNFKIRFVISLNYTSAKTSVPTNHFTQPYFRDRVLLPPNPQPESALRT
ncbi:hypothetical protein FA13DRAFT_1739032 [Coprinellus micaceus]|uniref:Uncharacterized protein n=1 Tax=Coprinellus micaceus TaxID=71717 RepID=A0A4Y7SS47_COPMI|nr:hypothetical protein FA13DRAFT_1739032 [Coprinellus micaceus]